MPHRHFIAFATLAALAGATASTGRAADAPAPKVIADIDLAGLFATRSPWRFVATQGPDIEDPVYGPGDAVPGAITLCLRAEPLACDAELRSVWPSAPPASDIFDEVHYLASAKIVRARSHNGRPLLWVQATSLHSGDGGHDISTQVLAYRPSEDRFVRVYERHTGSNNNEETRFIADGPLSGDIVSVEPTQNAPYGFWVSVNAYAPGHAYRQVLRYRSATRYNDGNPLAVIDSEMPNIQQRLGVWKAGLPLPLPSGPCPKPRLAREELWCR